VQRTCDPSLGGECVKRFGIGYENYREFIEENLYYIDKTWLVGDVIEKGGKVILFTRPRRFGKTLALSMLQTFFELEYDKDGRVVSKERYFDGKRIMEAPDELLSMMGQVPVIRLSLKSANQPDFNRAGLRIRDEIVSEYSRHSYLLNSKELSVLEKEHFYSFLDAVDERKLHTRRISGRNIQVLDGFKNAVRFSDETPRQESHDSSG